MKKSVINGYKSAYSQWGWTSISGLPLKPELARYTHEMRRTNPKGYSYMSFGEHQMTLKIVDEHGRDIHLSAWPYHKSL